MSIRPDKHPEMVHDLLSWTIGLSGHRAEAWNVEEGFEHRWVLTVDFLETEVRS